MNYFVYILRSEKDRKYYIGVASDVEASLRFHNAGLQRSTHHRIPFVLILYEVHADKSAALRREREIKNYKGGEAFKRLVIGK